MTPDDYAKFPAFNENPRLRSWNAWSYIDRRDGAQAVRKALEYDTVGMDVFIIANADTVMTTPVADLAAEVFPEIEFRRPVQPHETLLSIEKARRVLGYEPQFGWRNPR
jgi:nucleoside-diphosphate-sugar epimerase